ncbi:amidase family protein [Streptomyces sp. NPDC052107]|uniref:amidase family protein n=1 Tax=Streptomyces sp. NPDC052107 TaxID=3155632 RepID=UPI0034216AEB
MPGAPRRGAVGSAPIGTSCRRTLHQRAGRPWLSVFGLVGGSDGRSLLPADEGAGAPDTAERTHRRRCPRRLHRADRETQPDAERGRVRGLRPRTPGRRRSRPSAEFANLAGLSGLAVPSGQDEDGLPIGVQIIGPQWSEITLLGIAAALEEAGILPGFTRPPATERSGRAYRTRPLATGRDGATADGGADLPRCISSSTAASGRKDTSHDSMRCTVATWLATAVFAVPAVLVISTGLRHPCPPQR